MSRVAKLDEFFENGDRNTNSSSSRSHELRFTGNWFIDAGILGFVNLMEDVYGWDLEKLQEKIKENPEVVYYGYFPFAYMFRRSIVSGIYKQQEELRDLLRKTREKKSKIDEKMEKKKESLNNTKSSKRKQEIETQIKKLELQAKKFEKLITEISSHISLLNRELHSLKREFKIRVEAILKDYNSFIKQYHDTLFTHSEWIYTVLPKNKTNKLNKRLEKILDIAVELNLIKKNKDEKKDKKLQILKLLPTEGNFNIYPNANERNFYLYNPPKRDEYVVILYLLSLLRNDVENIKLLLGIKWTDKDEEPIRERISKFLELCKTNNLEYPEILDYIKESIECGFSKNRAIKMFFQKYKVSQEVQENLKAFLEEIYQNFREVINRRGRLITYEVMPDSTINPFLISPNEFSNISYTQPPTIKDIAMLLPNGFPPYIIYLTFFDAFLRIYEGDAVLNIMFYTPELTVSHSINKRIKTKMELTKSTKRRSLFDITWSAIIDELIETKSHFSLENMYLIEFESIEKLKLKGVEYIGISKLQASILIEDSIRDDLNVNLQIDNSDSKWILEEFIKNKPLYPLILKHVQCCINKNEMINRKSSLYALAIDAKIKENNNTELFSSDFFQKYRSIVNDIKETSRNLNIQATNISKLFDSRDDRQKTCYSLMAALKRRNRIAFTNILLKRFLEKSGLKEISYLYRFVFENIVSNDTSWENYALALVIGILSFGGGVSGEESED